MDNLPEAASKPAQSLSSKPPLSIAILSSPSLPHLNMQEAFVSPLLPLYTSHSLHICPCRSTPRRPPYSSRDRVFASAAAHGQSRGVNSTHHGKTDYQPAYSNDLTWRKRNASLVSEANANGIDSAIEMLWSLNQDGQAVTQNFNQVVSLLASKGRFEDGLELAEEAGRRGIANIITFRPLMKRCCTIGDGKGAKRVWKAMSEYKVEGDMFLYAELMGALVRSQDMSAAHRVLSSLHESGRKPHIVLYNTLLKGYAKRANVKRAFEILETIEQAGIRPDETTFNTILNTCVQAKDSDALNDAMSLMHKHKVKPGAPTFNTLLKLYSRAGKFEDALAIFEEMQQTVEPSIVTFNTLIDGCAHRGDMVQAAKFFDEMTARGMTPDICTMTSLLKGFGRSNNPKRAVELYEAMKEGGYQIEERTRYAVVNACLRGNDRENAMRLMAEMVQSGHRIRSRTWVWMLESTIWADDENGALETLRLMYGSGSMLDSSTRAAFIKETRDRGGFLRFLRELKAAKTSESQD